MKTKKLVIIAVSIILMGLIFQILPSKFTGMLTLNKEQFPAKLEITPNVTIHDETIKIKINSPYYIYRGQKKQHYVNNKIYFYNNNLRKGKKKICNQDRCKGDFIIEYNIPDKFKTRTDWPEGTYTAKIYDTLNEKYIEYSFELVNLSNPLIDCKDLDRGNDIYHKGETYSFKTGKQVKKEDNCKFHSNELKEYYCCNKTNPQYKEDIGMCLQIIECKLKCKDGSCYDYYS